MTVALGTVTAGLSTASLATEADSRPKNDHSVSVTTDWTATHQFGSAAVGIQCVGLAPLNQSRPMVAIAIRGSSLITVVIVCTWPASPMPRKLTRVISQTRLIATPPAKKLLVLSAGQKAAR